MSLGLCRQRRDSRLLRVSLISATVEDAVLGTEELDRVAKELSTRFGYGVEHEVRAFDGYRPAKESDLRHYRPWMAREGRVYARVWYNTKGGDQKFVISGLNKRHEPRVDWAFIHRQGEKPVSQQLPDGKSAWIFLRNGSDGCIPCTFLCSGCKGGSIRLAVSGLSPYGIDSEVVAESALDCVHSVLSARCRMEYARKGLAWSGYRPREVAHFSGPWSNLALMDYFHRCAAVLPDFAYPPDQAYGPEEEEEKTGSAREGRSWFPPWRTNR